MSIIDPSAECDSSTLMFHGMPPDDVRRAMCEWLERHGLEPNDVCVPGWVTADRINRRVLALGWDRNEQGNCYLKSDTGEPAQVELCSQLEAPPLPWPVKVLEYLRHDKGGRHAS